MMNVIKLLSALLVYFACEWSPPSSKAAERMNLLVIQTDEHSFRTLGCYRDLMKPDQALIWGPDAQVETPAIDSLAKRGAICTSFYATSPVCTPSRASFFTGVYPQHTGSPANDLPLRNDMVTFAEVLRGEGYQTGYAGKWHLDGGGKPQWAPRRQFGFADNRFMFNRGHWKKFELVEGMPRVAARKKGQPSYGLDGANEISFTTDWLTDRALDFIEENAAGPFCYHLSLPDPHGPNTVRPPYDTMYRGMVIRPPATFLNTVANPKWAPTSGNNGPKQFRADMMAAYFGMVKCIDDNVQRIINRLRKLDLLDTTVIVFTSDHGDLCYEHGRLNKGIPYEASARIPMIIAAPGKVNGGTVIDAALGTVDFAPTILPLLGAETPDGVQGRDFGRLLQKDGSQTSKSWKDVVILRNAGIKTSWMAAVSDRYKLVLSTSDRPWLFDLEQDPDELFNQLDKPIDRLEVKTVVRSLASSLANYQRNVGDEHLKNQHLKQQLADLLDSNGP